MVFFFEFENFQGHQPHVEACIAICVEFDQLVTKHDHGNKRTQLNRKCKYKEQMEQIRGHVADSACDGTELLLEIYVDTQSSVPFKAEIHLRRYSKLRKMNSA